VHREVEELFAVSGKVAFVTGGARHLGFDAASILAAAGCHLAISSRSLESAEAAAKRVRERYGVETLALTMDQRRNEDVAEAFRQVTKWKGRLDILVNNAGGTPGSSPVALLERDPDDIAELIQLNLTGMLYCCREAGGLMVEKGAGKIINIASVAGLLGRDRRVYERSGMGGQPVEYAAAKAGVIGMTRDLSGYLSPKGVFVNAISPGGFERGQPPKFIHDYSERTPLGRMGRDGIDLKGALLFLASPASDYVTGHNLVVDGGFSLWR